MLIRNANPEDAADLARLINMAGEGLPEYLWREEAERAGLDPVQLGAQRAAREDGGFSFRHARMADLAGSVAGMALAYRLADPVESGSAESLPASVRPLVELEARAPGSWYVNAVAAYPQFRGQGVGKALMADCEEAAVASGATEISLNVASENRGAYRLYVHLGYLETARLPLVPWPGCSHQGDWILMVKSLET